MRRIASSGFLWRAESEGDTSENYRFLATIIPKQGALSFSAYEPGAFILAFGETTSLPSPNATGKASS
jgi:hypothetical protein